MAKVKGTANQDIKELLTKHGVTNLNYLQPKMSNAAWQIFILATPVKWVPFEIAEEIITIGAQELFPDDDEKLVTLGRCCAGRAMKGIHQMFLKIPTPFFVIKRIPQLWRTYFDHGAAQIITFDEEKKDFIMGASSMPDLPRAMRLFVGGFMCVVMEMAGLKNCQIAALHDEPQCWKWHIKWV